MCDRGALAFKNVLTSSTSSNNKKVVLLNGNGLSDSMAQAAAEWSHPTLTLESIHPDLLAASSSANVPDEKPMVLLDTGNHYIHTYYPHIRLGFIILISRTIYIHMVAYIFTYILRL